MMNRRAFITLIGGAAAWSAAARGQQNERARSIGVLMSLAANDAEGQNRIAAFVQGLQQAGWTVGHNLQIEFRWTANRADDFRKYAAELVALAPEAILATGSSSVRPLLQASHTVPVVFVNVVDPVGAGFVESLGRPGGNATGFTQFEFSTTGKWVELLREISPQVTRAAVLRDPMAPSGLGQFAAIQAVAPSLGVEVIPVNVRNSDAELERVLASFARVPNGGMIVTGSGAAVLHRDLIVALAAKHKLPTVYYERFFVARGGLLSYGPNLYDQYRLAAGYVDRILRGEKPADLPVQASSKYQLVINLKTARTLGLAVPPSLLARADDVIE